MNKIKSFFRFVFVYKPLNEYQAHATKFQIFKFWCRNGLRRATIAVMVVALSGGSSWIYRQIDPKIVQADAVTIEVPKEQRLSDFPILMKICKAESSGKQFAANGNVIRGKVNPSDIGICQINEPTWNDKARKLGYDIYTEKGNEDMAIYIFVNYGTAPWNSSRDGINGWANK